MPCGDEVPHNNPPPSLPTAPPSQTPQVTTSTTAIATCSRSRRDYRACRHALITPPPPGQGTGSLPWPHRQKPLYGPTPTCPTPGGLQPEFNKPFLKGRQQQFRSCRRFYALLAKAPAQSEMQPPHRTGAHLTTLGFEHRSPLPHCTRTHSSLRNPRRMSPPRPPHPDPSHSPILAGVGLLGRRSTTP